MSPFLLVHPFLVLPVLLLLIVLLPLPKHEVVEDLLTERSNDPLGNVQLCVSFDPVLAGDHKVGQDLSGEVQSVVGRVQFFEELSVVDHVVLDGVVDIRDLGDVVDACLAAVEILLVLVPPLINQHL